MMIGLTIIYIPLKFSTKFRGMHIVARHEVKCFVVPHVLMGRVLEKEIGEASSFVLFTSYT